MKTTTAEKAFSLVSVPMSELRAANRAAGRHWFDRSAMRFFRSELPRTALRANNSPLAFFVSSEQFVGSNGIAAPRKYTVRVAHMQTGSVGTVGEFNKIFDNAEARAIAQGCAEFAG